MCVLQHLIDAAGPVTHAEVANTLRPQGFDRATIYRNLIELTQAGLVIRVELGDHVWRFEVRRAGKTEERDHPHFVCVDCGEVACLPSASVNIARAPGSKSSGTRKITEILLKGHCGQCS
jgi:Fur family ferric uptake transcriptional regulator